jgi:hypothetical protein
MKPALTRSLWLGISASAGLSFFVGAKSLENLISPPK